MSDQNEAPKTESTKTPLQQFLEHQGNAAQETVKALQALIPPEFKEHSKAAGQEFLQSFKVLIDGAQEAVNREMEKMKAAREANNDSNDQNGPTTTGKNKVKVEVS